MWFMSLDLISFLWDHLTTQFDVYIKRNVCIDLNLQGLYVIQLKVIKIDEQYKSRLHEHCKFEICIIITFVKCMNKAKISKV